MERVVFLKELPMKLGVSISSDFDDYGYLYKTLDANLLRVVEIASFPNELVRRFCKEINFPYQEFQIFWNDPDNKKNTKVNKFGRPYNPDAPKDAAKKLVAYCDSIIEIGSGDYHINMLGKNKLIKSSASNSLEKRYKF